LPQLGRLLEKLACFLQQVACEVQSIIFPRFGSSVFPDSLNFDWQELQVYLHSSWGIEEKATKCVGCIHICCNLA